jgi:hypothetical protein
MQNCEQDLREEPDREEAEGVRERAELKAAREAELLAAHALCAPCEVTHPQRVVKVEVHVCSMAVYVSYVRLTHADGATTVYQHNDWANYDDEMAYLTDLELGADEYIVALKGVGPGGNCFHLVTNKGRKREWCAGADYGFCAGACEGAWAARGNMFIALPPCHDDEGAESRPRDMPREVRRPIEVAIGGAERVEITTGMEDAEDRGGAAWKESQGLGTPDLDLADAAFRRNFKRNYPDNVACLDCGETYRLFEAK